jgi:phosphoglycolate phosphatase
MNALRKETLKKPTIVLFDMDGTTVRHVNPLFLSILEALDNVIYAISRMLFHRRQIVDMSTDPAVPRGLLVHRALHKMRRKPVDQIVQPCPGIFLLLNLFKDNNIPMGVVSNSLGKGYGHDILKKFKLAPYYDAKIFREDIHRSKPHPDPILRGLRAIKEEPSATDVIWYIGDRHKDIVAAIEANKLMDCEIVPFSYGLNAAIAVLKHNIGNDHIIMNYPDFYSSIKPLFPVDESNQKDRTKNAA